MARAPPAVTTPGSVQPGNTTGRSDAPAATKMRWACIVVEPAAEPYPYTTAEVPLSETTGVPVDSSAPASPAAPISPKPRPNRGLISPRRSPHTRAAGCLYIWLPRLGRSSTRTVRRPWPAAVPAAARPAGPPPITSRSHPLRRSLTFSVRNCSGAGGHGREGRHALCALVRRRQETGFLAVAEPGVQVADQSGVAFLIGVRPYWTTRGVLKASCFSSLGLDLLNSARM